MTFYHLYPNSHLGIQFPSYHTLVTAGETIAVVLDISKAFDIKIFSWKLIHTVLMDTYLIWLDPFYPRQRPRIIFYDGGTLKHHIIYASVHEMVDPWRLSFLIFYDNLPNAIGPEMGIFADDLTLHTRHMGKTNTRIQGNGWIRRK